MEVTLLRPDDWIVRHGLETGATIVLSTREFGPGATAVVRDIAPCPTIDPGEGEVVTGRFVTLSEVEVWDLTVRTPNGDETTVRGTPTHPVWSETAGDWLPLGLFQPGDEVRVAAQDGGYGLGTVASVTPLTTAATVYNLEVHGEHVYQIGSAGLLVHNNGYNCDEHYALLLKKKDLPAGEKLSPADQTRLNALEAADPNNVLDDVSEALVRANLTNSGVTVLGRYESASKNYMIFAREIGASYYDIGKAWDALTPDKRWEMNARFIQIIAGRQDSVRLSHATTNLGDSISFRRELIELAGLGYTKVNQWKLLPPNAGS